MHWIHNLDPVLLKMGPLQIRWYGLMYLVGFILGYMQFVRRYKKGLFALDPEQSQLLITYLMVGMMVGARLVYVFVYNPMYYMNHLTEIVAIWQGGLSFHGAMLGFIGGMILCGRKLNVSFFHLADNVCLGASVGIFFGRWGNFINGELYGRTTDVPWGIIFPGGGSLPRHPSQLYQAFGEGLCVFLILKWIELRERKKGFCPQPLGTTSASAEAVEEQKKKSKKNAPIIWGRTGIMAGCFLILYGIARFCVEFFREPDVQLGYFFGFLTMGQLLCLLMVIAGIIFIWYVQTHPRSQSYPQPQLTA